MTAVTKNNSKTDAGIMIQEYFSVIFFILIFLEESLAT